MKASCRSRSYSNPADCRDAQGVPHDNRRQTGTSTTHMQISTESMYVTRVTRVRSRFDALSIDGFIVSRFDETRVGTPAPANDRLTWLTGFDEGPGLALLLKKTAAVIVDRRYPIMARRKVDQSVFYVQSVVGGGISAFLEANAGVGTVIGYDPRLHTPDDLKSLRQDVECSGCTLRAVNSNPIDEAWGDERPPQSSSPVVPHPMQYCGETSASKRARIGQAIRRASASCALITSPGSVAWLLNIRGGDVPRSPLPVAQAIVDRQGTARLFLASNKITSALRDWLDEDVTIEPADQLSTALERLGAARVLVDPKLTPAWYVEALRAAGAELVYEDDPCALPRACKNATEIAGARAAHLRDGVALTRVLHWLAMEAHSGKYDELAVVARLETMRNQTGLLKDLSFDALVGFGPNGALPHYRPTAATNRRIEPSSLLLIDSGGQYLDGTTDVTRTVAVGEPTRDMREHFTLVLKGQLAMSRIQFPTGTAGSALDILARLPLWTRGLDYDHGTGHGVGSYLTVHEGPQAISKAPGAVALQPGMILSNEPGYYLQGGYGIRLENLQYVAEVRNTSSHEQPMLAFETLTLAPIDLNCVESGMLTDEERSQLNAYHVRVLSEIGALVPRDTRSWLADACRPLA